MIMNPIQPRIQASPQISIGGVVTVIPAGTAGLGCKSVALRAATTLHHWRAFRRRRSTNRWHRGCNWRFHLGMVVYNVGIVLVQPSDGGERPVGRATCHVRVALLLGRSIVHMKAGLVGF